MKLTVVITYLMNHCSLEVRGHKHQLIGIQGSMFMQPFILFLLVCLQRPFFRLIYHFLHRHWSSFSHASISRGIIQTLVLNHGGKLTWKDIRLEAHLHILHPYHLSVLLGVNLLFKRILALDLDWPDLLDRWMKCRGVCTEVSRISN